MKTQCRSIIILILMFIVCFFNLKHSEATHSIGGDITYECLGVDTYLVTLTLYNYCKTSATFGPLLSLNIASSCGSRVQAFDRDTVIDVSPVCPNMCTLCETDSCNFNFGGIEAHYYSDTVILDSDSCCEVRFFVDRCCRSLVTTIHSDPRFYIESTLNSCVSPCNNSPVFVDHPQIFACLGSNVILENYFTEPDNDSIVIERIYPLRLNGDTISYREPYSIEEPLAYLGKGLPSLEKDNGPIPFGFHFNSHTAQMMFRPTQPMSTTVALKISEFRGNEKVGSVIRDYSIFVDSCYNEPPVIEGFRSTVDIRSTVDVCIGDTLFYEIKASDPDSFGHAPDSVFIKLYEGPENLQIHEYKPGPVHATATLKWITTPEDSGRHEAIIIASDNGCPMSSYSYQILIINVIAVPDIEYEAENKNCGFVTFKASENQGMPFNFKWKSEDIFYDTLPEFTHFYPDTGRYSYTLDAFIGNCQAKFYDTVHIQDQWLYTNNYNVEACKNTKVLLEASYHEAVGPVSYVWSTADTGSSILYNVSEDEVVSVLLTDSLGCSATQFINIETIQLPSTGLNNLYTACPEAEFEINAGNPSLEHQWYDLNSNLLSTSHTFKTTEAGSYIHKLSDPSIEGCSMTDTFELFTFSLDTPVVNDVTVCPGKTAVFNVDGQFSTQYWFDEHFNDFLQSGNNFEVTPEENTTYGLLSEFNFGNLSCSLYQFAQVHLHDSPVIEMPTNIPASMCVYDNPVNLYEEVSAGIVWEGSSISDSMFDPSYAGAGTHDLFMSYSDSNGCSTGDTIQIAVYDLPLLDFTATPTQGETPLEVQINSISQQNLTQKVWYIVNEEDSVIEIFTDISDFLYTFNDTGIYSVSMLATDSLTACRDSVYKNAYITVEGALSVLKPAKDERGFVEIIPNPAESSFEVIAIELNDYDIHIFDIQGKALYSKSHITDNRHKINADEWRPGIYMVHIFKKGEFIQGKKLIIK